MFTNTWGVKLRNNRTFGYQIDEVVSNLRWRIASLKATAGDVPPDSYHAASIVVWGRNN